MFCPRCQATLTGAQFCSTCGRAVGPRAGVDFTPAPTVTSTPAPAPTAAPAVSSPRSVGAVGHAPRQARPWWMLPTVAISLALSAIGGYVLLQPPAPTSAAQGATEASTAPASAASQPAPPAEPAVTTVTETVSGAEQPPRPSSERRQAPRLVTDLPAGLKCKDLRTQGYSYASAHEYWVFWNVPDLMDEDLNGIPCESVYPGQAIDIFYDDSEFVVENEPGGLSCRHLARRGYTYDDAIAYWKMHGRPTLMDEDGDAVPCEAVYPEATIEYFLHNP